MYILSGYLSPAEHAPAFVIPVFTTVESNYLFAQKVSKDNRVLDMRPISEDLFFPVPVIAPLISKYIGEVSLLAYWASDSRVIVGSATNIVEMLEKEEEELEPFAQLEIANLLGDRDSLNKASSEIAKTFSRHEIGARWKSREIKAFDRRIEINGSGNEIHNKLKDIDARVSIFESLFRDASDRNWPTIWKDLWHQGYRREDLRAAAYWWIELGHGLRERGGDIIAILTREDFNEQIRNFSRKWLEKNSISDPYWPQIIRSIVDHDNEDAIFLGISALESADIDRRRDRNNWPVIWRALWARSSGKIRSILENLAVRKFDEYTIIDKRFASNVIITIISSRHEVSSQFNSLCRRYVTRDLRSEKNWVQIYYFIYNIYKDDKEFIRSGDHWLRHHGGNLNSWFEIWKLMKDTYSDSEKFSIGLQWLMRARWDLSVWPTVFNDVSSISRTEDDFNLMTNLAKRWSGSDNIHWSLVLPKI